jgi:hypothetical protein
VHGYLGFGLQASIPVGSSKIEEHYSTITWQWNIAIRVWEQVNQFAGNYYSDAVKTYIYSFTVPAGLSFDIGNASEFRIGFEYFNARRSPQIGKNYSEGIMVQAGFRYNFSIMHCRYKG